MTNEVLQYRPFAMEDLSDIAHILAPLWHSDVPGKSSFSTRLSISPPMLNEQPFLR